jgi:transcription elongation factor Elf1
MTDREAMKLALKALELLTGAWQTFDALDYGDNAIAALKERLADPMREVQRLGQEIEQEPVALHCCGYTDASAVKWNPLNGVVQCHNCGQTYTPPQRTEQEPVAWIDLQKEAQQIVESKSLWKRFIGRSPLANDIACWMADFALQHHPPQRTWVGLTDKVITKVVDSMPRGINGWMSDWDLYEFARAIEARLKENT